MDGDGNLIGEGLRVQRLAEAQFGDTRDWFVATSTKYGVARLHLVAPKAGVRMTGRGASFAQAAHDLRAQLERRERVLAYAALA